MADKLCQLWKQIGRMVRLHEYFILHNNFFDIRHFYVQTKLFSLESPDDLELGALSRLTEAISSFHKNNLIFYKIVKVAVSDEFSNIDFLDREILRWNKVESETF